MRRAGIYVLNIVFLFFFAVVLETQAPGAESTNTAIGYGVAFLAWLFVAYVGQWVVRRYGRAEARGDQAYLWMATGAAFLMFAGLSGLVGWGVAAAAQTFISLALVPRTPRSVQWEGVPYPKGIDPYAAAAAQLYERRPDGSFVPVTPSAPRSRQVH